MFYRVKVRDHVRIPPESFKLDLDDAMIEQIKKKYEGHISKEVGTVIDVLGIDAIKDGVIIPGDGATFYETEFTLLSFLPEMQEVIPGTIKDIADFGGFFTIGPSEGMIHISQTMNDFVSFNKEKTLVGKETKRLLRVGDRARARIISISYKDLSNPKIGLTMRQEGLGKDEWIQEDIIEKKKPAKKTVENKK